MLLSSIPDPRPLILILDQSEASESALEPALRGRLDGWMEGGEGTSKKVDGWKEGRGRHRAEGGWMDFVKIPCWMDGWMAIWMSYASRSGVFPNQGTMLDGWADGGVDIICEPQRGILKSGRHDF